jgi:Cu+-exporting ATPase
MVGLAEASEEIREERLVVRGMTCTSCAARVERALGRVPGVQAAHVDLNAGTAALRYDPRSSPFELLQQAVASAGYTLEPRTTPAGPASAPSPAGHATTPSPYRAQRLLPPLKTGFLSSLGMLAFYLGAITLAQGWAHATTQLATNRWLAAAIVVGCGLLVGAFSYLRQQSMATRTRVSSKESS